MLPKAVTTPKLKVTSLQISEEFINFLTQVAEEYECSKADIIREALDAWVEENVDAEDLDFLQ